MSYARTPDLPREHPLAKLIERSARANTLPSCANCAEAEKQSLGVLICGHAYNRKPGTMMDSTQPLLVSISHFCAAWETRA